jgi:uncharacterized protein YcnI
VLAAPAFAHVEISPDHVSRRAVSHLTISVENERSNAQTVKVVMKLPARFIATKLDPKAGWRVSATSKPLTKPLRVNGRKVSRRIDIVTWKATRAAARFGPGHAHSTFGLRGVARAAAGAALIFPTLQTYSSGEVVHWIGAPASDEPAPRVVVR